MDRQTQRSELQERIAADLREKAAKTNLPQDSALDDVEDLAYMAGTKKTTTLAWAWIAIIIVAAAIIISFIALGS